MPRFFKHCILSIALTLATTAAFAADQKLALAAPFTDNMILQREKALPVWGFDRPGSKVTVKFAGQTKTAIADTFGDWLLKLDPLKMSRTERPFKVTNDKEETVILRGVLVGEVWFSSGQSNMVWIAGKSMCRELARELAGTETDIPVREINIQTLSALYPQKKATSDGGWKTCKEANGFSALSLAFAHELYKELDMPIGILLSAHSNTRVEAFASRPSFENHAKLKQDADLIHKGDPLTEQGLQAFKQYYKDLKAWEKEAGAIATAGGALPGRPNLPGIAGMWRGPSQFFNGKIAPLIPYAIRGAIWCQGTSNASDSKIYAARMEALLYGWRKAWNMPEMPFYFTQMQSYGAPNPDSVGFADIRQAQHLFFVNNRKNVGMVVQTDLNSARPGGIHYYNKLHPGMRMARWALAKDYGKDIPYTGPIYNGYTVEGNKVVVCFEKESLFGGLMVGNKGLAKDYRTPDRFVEPARPTPDDTLNHFRLCGKDRQWHAAHAVITGDTVVVTSETVPEPIGVQYAYNGVPMHSNLYNRAGLPATPFAAINGELIFEKEDKPLPPATTTVAPATRSVRPYLHIANYLRTGAVLQRGKPIPIWGHANKGATVTVTLGETTQKTTVNDLEQWSVTLPPRKASVTPLTLSIKSSVGRERSVSNVLVGDVWFLTGSTQLTSEWPYNKREKNPTLPEALPLVREFRRKTKASTSATPRKRRFETGGGKYQSYWATADYSLPDQGVTMFAYHFAKALNRPGVPQAFITMSSGRGGRSPQMASPLSWTSFDAVKNVDNPRFKARIDELLLQYPDSDVAKKALTRHITEVKAYVETVIRTGQTGADLSRLTPRVPAFPVAGQSKTVKADTIPTYTYNWCVSPHTPMAVSGVIWIPSSYNIGYTPTDYAAELEIYANSLATTYKQPEVFFLYGQPTPPLVEGIGEPTIPNSKCVLLHEWPKSLKQLAVAMAGLAKPVESAAPQTTAEKD